VFDMRKVHFWVFKVVELGFTWSRVCRGIAGCVEGWWCFSGFRSLLEIAVQGYRGACVIRVPWRDRPVVSFHLCMRALSLLAGSTA
jgi:hypothetical protein